MDEKELVKELGKKIRARRDELNMSQAELAQKVGLIQAKISQIEIGERRIDMLKELPKFAEVLGKPVQWFIMGSEVSKNEITLESVVRRKCPSLGDLTVDDLDYLGDLVGDLLPTLLERDSRFGQKIRRKR